jgi:polysaccharide biosynthesis protein PslH
MKILWVKSDFLHPTTKGGQIRTLEILRRIRTRHEIHYVAFTRDSGAEALERSSEYCHRAFPVPLQVPKHGTLGFYGQLLKGLFSSKPVAVLRYRSPEMQRTITALRALEHYDAIVCDFLFAAPNIRDLSGTVLFQHNVETMIWRRHTDVTVDTARKLYFRLQTKRMFAYEETVSRAVQHVITVSQVDAQLMKKLFGITDVSHVATGVDVNYFSAPAPSSSAAGLIFLGSMDWLPNIDAIKYFTADILPLIRHRHPEVSLAIVGREPSAEINEIAARDRHIHVTGTVADVRPHLWSSQVSIVPLRIGGGSRLKIYESMAAGIPVVSTTVGAEGLTVHPPHDIRIADTPKDFAAECIQLLENVRDRRSLADAARRLVNERFTWERIAVDFERILEHHRNASL